MTFDEVIQRVTANPGQSFTGIQLRADGNYLGIYTVSTGAGDEDDPNGVHIHFEGGPLFAGENRQGYGATWGRPCVGFSGDFLV